MVTFVKNLVEYRELLISLTVSGIKAKYKQSILGVGWAILQPLALMVIAFFVFSRFIKVPSDNIPYPIFAYVALVPWTLFSTGISFAIPSLVQNINLLRKIYFPREVFVISAILASLFDFLIASTIFVFMLAFYNVTLTLNILYFPLILLTQLILMVGVSLLGAIVNVAFRDAERSLPVIFQMWMLASPVVYSLRLVPESLRNIYILNPMVGIIDAYRKIFLEGSPPNFYYLSVSLLISFVVFIAGYWVFKKGEKVIADII